MRSIVQIDETRCDGCGQCIPSCHEGALEIVDGKARVVAEKYCDGLGACLGVCPRDAITIVEREAEAFDEEAVRERLSEPKPVDAVPTGGCPGAAAMKWASSVRAGAESAEPTDTALTHWPVQLRLVPPHAPFLAGADLLLAADCVPVAMPDFQARLLAGRAVLIGCPKFDDAASYVQRLTDILAANDVKSLTVAHMEVPCCHGMLRIAREAVAQCGKDVPLRVVEIGLQGDLRE